MAEEQEVAKTWFKRFEESSKEKEKWEAEFEVKRSAAYFLGHQRTDPQDENNERKVVVNKIAPAIRATLPSLYFSYPYVKVHASPARADTPGSRIEERAQLLQDTVNTLIRDPRSQFQEQTTLALKEAFWAFGAVEVVYSADFIENPNAKRPALKEDGKTKLDSEPKQPVDPIMDAIAPAPILTEPEQIVSDETFYVRRIPAKSILVSKNESAIIEENDWIGYCEWLPLEDVKRAAAYRNTRDLKPTAAKQESGEPAEGQGSGADMVKLYKIWDQRTRVRYVFAEGHDRILLKEKYKRLPLFFLRFDVLPDKFYPVPPIYGSLGSQDEYNDSREMLRKLRKAIVPRYTYGENALKPEQIEKLESGEIGVYIPTSSSNPSPIQPVTQPSLNDNVVRTLGLSAQEFTETSGVSGESRQMAASDTATQASIIAQKENIQDTYDRQIVAKWLGAIGKEILLLAIDKLVLPKWIRINSDPFSEFFPQDAQNIASLYQEITLEQLSEANADLRWDVSIDMESMSPVSEQQKQAAWNQSLAMLSNPGIAKVLAMSQPLLKRTLDLNGIKSAKDQAAIADALQKLAQMEMQMAQVAAQKGQASAAPGVSPMPGMNQAQGGIATGPRPAGPGVM